MIRGVVQFAAGPVDTEPLDPAPADSGLRRRVRRVRPVLSSKPLAEPSALILLACRSGVNVSRSPDDTRAAFPGTLQPSPGSTRTMASAHDSSRTAGRDHPGLGVLP